MRKKYKSIEKEEKETEKDNDEWWGEWLMIITWCLLSILFT